MMKFIARLAKSFQDVFQNSPVEKSPPYSHVIRQNSPPDERDVNTAEEAADPKGQGGIADKSPVPKNLKSRAKKAGGHL